MHSDIGGGCARRDPMLDSTAGSTCNWRAWVPRCQMMLLGGGWLRDRSETGTWGAARCGSSTLQRRGNEGAGH